METPLTTEQFAEIRKTAQGLVEVTAVVLKNDLAIVYPAEVVGRLAGAVIKLCDYIIQNIERHGIHAVPPPEPEGTTN